MYPVDNSKGGDAQNTMTILDVVQAAVTDSLGELWSRFVLFLPTLIGALVVFILGWVIAIGIGRLIQRILDLVRLNEPFERITGLRSTVERAGLDLNVSKFIGGLVKWFLFLVALLATANILGLQEVADFLNNIIGYLPNVVVAAVILVVGVIAGNFVGRVTRASIDAAHLPHGSGTGAIAKWAVIVFAFLAALVQLRVAESLIQTLFTAFAAMVAIAGGLAFGLGGKDLAGRILKHLESDATERR